jgi:protease I
VKIGRWTLATTFIFLLGTQQYFDDLTARRLVREYAQAGKIVGAICIAPVILARAGLLSGPELDFELGNRVF